jgi:hypothetical protein
MSTTLSRSEQENKRKGFITSTITHTILILLLLLPLLRYPNPPPGQEGILVNLGADFGQGNENAPEEAQPVEAEQPQPTEPVVTPPPPEPEPVREPEIIRTEDPSAVALRKQQEEERKKQREEADKVKREREEADRIKRQQEEAERKRKEEEARRAQETRDRLSGAFGGGEGDGKGNTGQQGNQGSSTGDPNASNLSGVSTGQGQVGGGLGSRGIVNSPKVTDNSQHTGMVVLRVCVDSRGNVVEATYTQDGSNTTNSQLQSIAIANAQKWKFSPSDLDRQCGTIRYDFRFRPE